MLGSGRYVQGAVQREPAGQRLQVAGLRVRAVDGGLRQQAVSCPERPGRRMGAVGVLLVSRRPHPAFRRSQRGPSRPASGKWRLRVSSWARCREAGRSFRTSSRGAWRLPGDPRRRALSARASRSRYRCVPPRTRPAPPAPPVVPITRRTGRAPCCPWRGRPACGAGRRTGPCFTGSSGAAGRSG